MADKPQRDLTAREVWYRTFYKRLEKYKWNRSETARSLGVAVITVHRMVKKFKKHGLQIPDNPNGPKRVIH